MADSTISEQLSKAMWNYEGPSPRNAARCLSWQGSYHLWVPEPFLKLTVAWSTLVITNHDQNHHNNKYCTIIYYTHMAMDQYLYTYIYIPFLGGWTSIYQRFWCSPGVQGFYPSPYNSYNIYMRRIVWQSATSSFYGIMAIKLTSPIDLTGCHHAGHGSADPMIHNSFRCSIPAFRFWYPLVSIQKTMENQHLCWENSL